MVQIIFFTELNRSFCVQNIAYSSAGEQVQREILDSLEMQFPDNDSVLCVSYQPFQIWPSGPLFVKSLSIDNFIFPAYINLPVIKTYIFSFYHILFSLRYKPKYIFKYNINFLSSLSLFCVNLFSKTKICLVVQDVNILSNSCTLKRFSNLLNRAALIISNRFDGLIPITQRISDDFGMPTHKSIVFPGGVTAQTRRIIQLGHHQSYATLQNRAVFAGALEPYNGVDVLISIWEKVQMGLPLYIFGNGSLSEEVKRASLDSRSNIFYMGQCDEEIVSSYIASSSINICLRYSKNIEEEYFFPSKFVNLCAAPGAIIVNKFKNIPESILQHCHVLEDDSDGVFERAKNADANLIRMQHEGRMKWIEANGDWHGVVTKMMKLLRGT